MAAEKPAAVIGWSAEQYVRRVIVETAQETGQPVRDVAGEAFALTLWTWSEMQEMKREDAVQRMGERTDLAGQVAIAFQAHGTQWRAVEAALSTFAGAD